MELVATVSAFLAVGFFRGFTNPRQIQTATLPWLPRLLLPSSR